MSIVVNLQGFSPPARADGVPFTKAQIEEGEVADGAFVVIDTIALEPLDVDPEHPSSRNLTTTKATLVEGFYRVVWIDAAANESAPSAPVQDLSELAGGVRPTVTDIAALLRARTKVRGGAEAGTFNAVTRPTADQVDELISDALDEVLGKVKAPEAATDYERRVRGAVRLYAAVLVELSYFPEQAKADNSAASVYRALYESRIKALIAEGETGEPQGEGGADGDSPGDSFYSFPEDAGGQIGLNTLW